MMRFDRWVAFALSLFAAGTVAAQGKVEVHWLGQAATKITTPGGKVIMIDPLLTKDAPRPRLSTRTSTRSARST